MKYSGHRKIFSRRAQGVTEYTVIAVCLIAVLLVMQSYVRRGMAGRIKNVVDSNMGEQFDPERGNYTTVIAQSGDSATVTEIVSRTNAGGAGGNTAWYTLVHQVSGPGSVELENATGTGTYTLPITDSAGNSLTPMNTTTIKQSEVTW